MCFSSHSAVTLPSILALCVSGFLLDEHQRERERERAAASMHPGKRFRTVMFINVKVHHSKETNIAGRSEKKPSENRFQNAACSSKTGTKNTYQFLAW